MSSNFLNVKKTLAINIKGSTDSVITESNYPKEIAINCDDFHGIIPKIVVKEGDNIKRGEVVFFSKDDERIKITSPVSGKVKMIVRGEKRKIEKIIILSEDKEAFKKFENLQDTKNVLLESGLWALIKQRPYDVIANPDKKPKNIFISTYNTNPLSPLYEVSLSKKLDEFQRGIDELKKLVEGKIFLGVDYLNPSSPFRKIQGVEIYDVKGNHPAGNVGVHINKISPINKGDIYWTLNPGDVTIIGTLFKTGAVDFSKIITLAGEGIQNPRYIKIIPGTKMSEILLNEEGLKKNKEYRIISGNVFTGRNEGIEGYLGYYDEQISVIPEGREDVFLGWLKPVFNKISYFKALTFSWLMPNKEYSLDTNIGGNKRAFVVTGDYERVFPMNIYPVQLMKACLAKDIEKMEELGIYEVAPEDFALTEFICPSKINHQKIIRDGLDLMLKEMGK